MESDIALELWQRSPDYGIYYKYMVADGDSSAWITVRFTYGSCNQCIKYHTKMTGKEQDEFNKSAEGELFWENHRDNNNCMCVIKENCINHGSKSLTSACRKIRESNKKNGVKGKKQTYRCSDSQTR